MKTKKNDTSKEKTTFTAREVAVLVEDLKSQFRIFGDELKTINKRLEGIETTQARMWEKLTQIDLRLIKVESDIATIKQDIAYIKEDLKTFDKRISHLETIK